MSRPLLIRSPLPRPLLRRLFLRRAGRARWVLPIIAVSILVTPVVAGASGQPISSAAQNLRTLQAQRDKVRAQKAQKASSVNTLKASDGQITSALSALASQVDSQTQELEDAKRGVQQAEADATAAAQAEDDAGRRLTALRASMREQAIAAYINVPGEQDWSILSDDDPTVAMSRRTLMEFQTGRNLDAAEEFRSLQEDLGLARQAKEGAKARAQSHQSDVKTHLDQLAAAQAQQQQFQDQVETRMDQALSEADALAGIDNTLSGQITAKQSAIAQQLAAQARANQAARAALTSSGRAPKSSSGGAAPAIVPVGSAHIVSVGGIQVDQSIASNLAALLSAAAAAGIHFGGGGYRDPSAQIAVRRAHCGTSQYAIYQMPASSCHPPTARPGTSMHERGLAVDFTIGGTTIPSGSVGFNWLRANAARYGFYNLPSEPWHWSVNGD
jgi:septal ring factor EnvC (AmiA/AmiB activator)